MADKNNILTEQDALLYKDALLYIEIDNNWNSSEFAILFDSINGLYGYYSIYHQTIYLLEILSKQYNIRGDFHKLPTLVNISNKFKRISIDILQNPKLINSDPSKSILWNIKLTVNKIKFGSKGSVDLFGVGAIFENIRVLIMHYIPSKGDEIDRELRKKEIEEKDQKILSMKINNLKKLDLSSDEITNIIGLEYSHISQIKRLIDQRKVKGLKIQEQSKN